MNIVIMNKYQFYLTMHNIVFIKAKQISCQIVKKKIGFPKMEAIGILYLLWGRGKEAFLQQKYTKF